MRRAFTLAEVILSTFIMSIVMLSVFSIFPSSAIMVRKGENRLAGDALAQSDLEACRAAPYAALNEGLWTVGNVTIGTTEFGRTRTIFKVTGSTDTRYLKGVRVKVYWMERGQYQCTTQESWMVCVER